MAAARKAVLAATVAVMLLPACGDRVPESGSARQFGAAPKQSVDEVTNDTARALELGAQRARQGSD